MNPWYGMMVHWHNATQQYGLGVVTALLSPSHVPVLSSRHANWLPKSTRALLYGRSLVLLEPRYTDGH